MAELDEQKISFLVRKMRGQLVALNLIRERC